MQYKAFSRLGWALIIAAIAGIVLWIGDQAVSSLPPPDLIDETAVYSDRGRAIIGVEAPAGTVSAIVASSSSDRQRGLSGLESLGADEGMLFIFPEDGLHGFWMADMHFPIDIVWISADKSVVGVASGVPPGSFPEVFIPPSPVRYVLELNSGGAERLGIATGTVLVF